MSEQQLGYVLAPLLALIISIALPLGLWLFLDALFGLFDSEE